MTLTMLFVRFILDEFIFIPVEKFVKLFDAVIYCVLFSNVVKLFYTDLPDNTKSALLLMVVN